MRLLLLSFALATNLLFAVVFLSLAHFIWQKPSLVMAQHKGHVTALPAKKLEKPSTGQYMALQEGPPIPEAVTVHIESYALQGSFQQTVEETTVTPSPTPSTDSEPSANPTNSVFSTSIESQTATTSSDTIVTPTTTPVVYPTSSFDDVYKQAGAKFGVPWQILYAIHKTETGCRNGPILNHSGSGAQGPMQFMPATWRTYGIDGDGDGVADINNAVDAIYSAASFLARHGSILVGLHAYGGDTASVLELARSRGYTQ